MCVGCVRCMEGSAAQAVALFQETCMIYVYGHDDVCSGGCTEGPPVTPVKVRAMNVCRNVCFVGRKGAAQGAVAMACSSFLSSACWRSTHMDWGALRRVLSREQAGSVTASLVMAEQVTGVLRGQESSDVLLLGGRHSSGLPRSPAVLHSQQMR